MIEAIYYDDTKSAICKITETLNRSEKNMLQ